jgi:hypothetical protein
MRHRHGPRARGVSVGDTYVIREEQELNLIIAAELFLRLAGQQRIKVTSLGARGVETHLLMLEYLWET